MHASSLKRMEWFVQTFLKSEDRLRVLDVGSFDVNGCYRQFFDAGKFDYIGLDMEAGPNVDIVPAAIYDWKELKEDSFDVVISGQALEHIEFFWVTVGEMVRVLKKGGILCIIAPNGFAEHRYPVDCYRFFTDGMVALSRYFGLELLHAHTNRAPTYSDKDWFSLNHADAMLVARKPYSGEAVVVDLAKYKCIPVNLDDVGRGLVPFIYVSPKSSLFHRAYRKIGRLIGAI